MFLARDLVLTTTTRARLTCSKKAPHSITASIRYGHSLCCSDRPGPPHLLQEGPAADAAAPLRRLVAGDLRLQGRCRGVAGALKERCRALRGVAGRCGALGSAAGALRGVAGPFRAFQEGWCCKRLVRGVLYQYYMLLQYHAVTVSCRYSIMLLQYYCGLRPRCRRRHVAVSQ